jgi:hypothetical protein
LVGSIAETVTSDNLEGIWTGETNSSGSTRLAVGGTSDAATSIEEVIRCAGAAPAEIAIDGIDAGDAVGHEGVAGDAGS